MNKLRCLVIDPDRNDRDLIKHYIEKLPTLHLMTSFSNPIEAILYLQTHPIDLIFMDFTLPELNGNDFLQLLNPKPLIIFTSAHREHALEGFQLDAADFLLKPLDFQAFLKAANKASRLFYLAKSALQPNSEATAKHYIVLKSNRKFHRICTESILYIEGMKEYIAIHLENNNRLLFLHSLRNLESILPPGDFIRIHKSYIVSVNKISAMEGNQLYLGEVKIPVGESYKNHVFEMIFS